MTPPIPGRIANAWLSTQRTSLLRLTAFAERLHPTTLLPRHLRTGIRGELEALFFLRRRGYIVVARRWRSPDHNGDIDLVAWHANTLCFVEVKARTARDMAPAALAINESKRSMLRRMARSYLRSLPEKTREQPLKRFDVVSVYLLPTGIECELLADAFPWRTDDSARYGV